MTRRTRWIAALLVASALVGAAPTARASSPSETYTCQWTYQATVQGSQTIQGQGTCVSADGAQLPVTLTEDRGIAPSPGFCPSPLRMYIQISGGPVVRADWQQTGVPVSVPATLNSLGGVPIVGVPGGVPQVMSGTVSGFISTHSYATGTSVTVGQLSCSPPSGSSAGLEKHTNATSVVVLTVHYI